MYRYVPDATFDHPQLVGDAVFSQSLLLLNDGLASGLLLEQYEQLYRRNMYLTIEEAKRLENLTKNRYRDIAPCKHFRWYNLITVFDLCFLAFIIV